MSAKFQETEPIIVCFTQDNIWKMSGIYVHKHKDMGWVQEMFPAQREGDIISPVEATSFRQKVFVFSAVDIKQLLSTLLCSLINVSKALMDRKLKFYL